MRLVVTLFLLILSLNLSTARVRQRTNVISSSTFRTVDQKSSFTQSHKSLNNERHIKRVQILNSTGLDGKVRRIHLDPDEEDKPGIRAYGLPKKHLQDSGIIERVHLGQGYVDDVSYNGRLVEAYGMPKDNMNTNGFIERLPLPNPGRQPVSLRSRAEDIRLRRSVRTGSENQVEGQDASEAEDMQAQEAKVFRPLFVYRQQVAARERRKHARNVSHRNHRHAAHQPCDHRRVIY